MIPSPLSEPPPPYWVRARAYIEWTFLRWRTPPRPAATPRHPLGYTVEIAPTRGHQWTWLVRHPRTGITIYTGVERTEAEAIRQATRPWVNR